MAKLNIEKAVNLTSENEGEVKAAELSDFQIFKITEDMGGCKDFSSSKPNVIISKVTYL